MNDKEAIIDKIITDARTAAASVLKSSEEQYEAAIKKARDEAGKMKDVAKAVADGFDSEAKRRRLSVAQLDLKKYLLERKKEVISAVFSSAIEKVSKEKDYIDSVISLIKKYAEVGDEVVICDGDKKNFTDKMLSEVFTDTKVGSRAKDGEKTKTKALKSQNEKAELKLAVSKSTGNFRAGVILKGTKIDKNLTYDLLLEQYCDEIEAKVAELLFS